MNPPAQETKDGLHACGACGYPLYAGESCPVCADNAELLADDDG